MNIANIIHNPPRYTNSKRLLQHPLSTHTQNIPKNPKTIIAVPPPIPNPLNNDINSGLKLINLFRLAIVNTQIIQIPNEMKIIADIISNNFAHFYSQQHII